MFFDAGVHRLASDSAFEPRFVDVSQHRRFHVSIARGAVNAPETGRVLERCPLADTQNGYRSGVRT